MLEFWVILIVGSFLFGAPFAVLVFYLTKAKPLIVHLIGCFIAAFFISMAFLKFLSAIEAGLRRDWSMVAAASVQIAAITLIVIYAFKGRAVRERTEGHGQR